MRKHREMMGNHRNWSEMVKWWENDGWVDKQNQGVAPCISRIISSFQHHYQKQSCSYLNHHFPWWSHHVCWVESSFFMIFQAPSLLGNLLGPSWVPGSLGSSLFRSACSSLARRFLDRAQGITFSMIFRWNDHKMEVLYHIRPYFVGIFSYIGLT